MSFIKKFAIQAKRSLFSKDYSYAHIVGEDFRIGYGELSQAKIFENRKKAREFLNQISNPPFLMRVIEIS
jgi:hypothetical protein